MKKNENYSIGDTVLVTIDKQRHKILDIIENNGSVYYKITGTIWVDKCHLRHPFDEDEIADIVDKMCSEKFIGSDEMKYIVSNLSYDLEQASIDAYRIGCRDGYCLGVSEVW